MVYIGLENDSLLNASYTLHKLLSPRSVIILGSTDTSSMDARIALMLQTTVLLASVCLSSSVTLRIVAKPQGQH